MKQILQNLKTGKIEIAEVPCPLAGREQVLIQTKASLISSGTERMLIEFSKANLIQKARLQPDKVVQVLNKIKTDGLMPTLETVFRKLDEPLPLGYCNAGVVIEVGSGVVDLQPGDRVISNGNHAEIVCVSRNLVVKVPEEITDEQAAFTTLASIALQGIRLTKPTLGEKFMVFGMGLIGLLTVQLLNASGCEVLAIDFNTERLKLAESFGAKTVDLSTGVDPISAALSWTSEQGVDAVLITASAKSDEIIHQAAEACRKRGRIVLVGVADLNLRRSDFYEKELTFQVSCSYGPGRYDEKYEQDGQDYPLGYVRWTEQRNFKAILEAIRTNKLHVEEIITHRYPFKDALLAYERIQNDHNALGVILQYPSEANQSPVIRVQQSSSIATKEVVVGVIGAGGFANGILLPSLSRTKARLLYVADLNATAASHAAKKFGASLAVTDYRIILNDPIINVVFIVVGHHLHSNFVIEALKAGKHVFVEKPLAINEQQLQNVTEAVRKTTKQLVMVGFNRRFSPHIVKIKQLLSNRTNPLCMNMTINAGRIPSEHWIQNPERGGGRIVGEACHFIDSLSHIADSPIKKVSAMMVGEGPAIREDKMSIVLGFANGSVGTVNYFSNGSKSYPKERLEVFSDERVITMENFRITMGYGFKRFKRFKTWKQDKGHVAEITEFINRVNDGGDSLIPFEEIVNVTMASFAVAESAKTCKTRKVQ